MNNEKKKRDGGLIGRERKRVGERGFVGWKRGKWLEGTAEAQAELDPRLRGRARAEPGLLREEPGLEARGGTRGGGGPKIGGGCGRAGAGARARGPSFRFSQLFPWPAVGKGREREWEAARRGRGGDGPETLGQNA